MARFLPLPDRRHIRLLQLLPTQSPNDLRGSLSVVSLDEAIASSRGTQVTRKYDALSYAWGQADKCHEIILNGWSCSIQENLWSFLIHYQCHTSFTHLWIDAICIDQKNVAERNNQVQMMAEIYQTAQTVLVWLGPASEESDDVMDVIESRTFKHRLDSETLRIEGALRKWCSREYWFRMWVIQEFLLPNNLKILCGSKQISYTAAETFFATLHANGVGNSGLGSTSLTSPPHSLLQYTSRPYSLLQQRSRSSIKKAPLLTLLVKNRDSICSEPLDRIFAMLGLACDCTATKTILVDYSATAQDLFGCVMSFCNVPGKDVFRYGRFLRRILCAEPSEPAKRSMAVRSSKMRDKGQRQDLSSTGSNSGSSGLVMRQDGLRLNVTGFRTGKIVRLGEPVKRHHLRMQQSNECSTPSKLENLALAYQLESLTNGQYGLRHDAWHLMLDDVNEDDIRRLDVPMCVLQAVSERSFPASTAHDQPKPAASAVYAYAVVYFSGHASKEFAPGLTFGNCHKDDIVIQFPGYDIAVTMSSGQAPRITGRMLCMSSEGPTRDTVTFEELKYNSIRSPADSMIPQSNVNLVINADELLELVA